MAQGVNPQTLKSKIQARTTRSKRNVFIRVDFEDLGGYDQVGRALRSLVDRGCIMKIG